MARRAFLGYDWSGYMGMAKADPCCGDRVDEIVLTNAVGAGQSVLQ